MRKIEALERLRNELNTRAERTCECESSLYWDSYHGRDFYEHRLSCGHTITSDDEEPPNYCPNCRAKTRATWG